MLCEQRAACTPTETVVMKRKNEKSVVPINDNIFFKGEINEKTKTTNLQFKNIIERNIRFIFSCGKGRMKFLCLTRIKKK